MTENNKPKTRYFYPYCGYWLGFCKSLSGCRLDAGEECIYFSARHPISNDLPHMVSSNVFRRGTHKVRKGGHNAKTKTLAVKA